MKKERLLLVVAMALATIGALSSCSTDDFGPDNTGEGTPDEEGKIVFDISIAPTDDDGQQTRVATGTDFKSEWEDGDEIGVFAKLVNPNNPVVTLEQSGNPLHNVKLTYTSGKWVGDAWWPTLADFPANREMYFFAYYPYNAAATDPTAIAFAVKTDQSNTTYGKPNYNLSDLLFGESTHNYERGGKVELTFHHALSLVQVNVPVGTLTGSGPNGELEVSLMARAKATVNLNLCNIQSEAKPAATDNDPVAIRMQRVEDPSNTTSYTYRALVPAQDFAAGSRIFRLNHEGQLFIDAPLTNGVSLAWSKVAKFTRYLPPSALQTVKIEAGTFLMGSPTTETDHQSNETQHEVTLTKGFRMCKYEITCAQFAEFLNAVEAEYGTVNVGSGITSVTATYNGKVLLMAPTTYNNTVKWNNGKWEAPTNQKNTPVNSVTWYGADEYARWVGGSLPTEAQWEYACRAETTTAWSFGANASKIGDYAWCGSVDRTPQPVGQKMPNPWGLYDMHGNVSEWCLDYTDGPEDYQGPAVDPVNNVATNYHIMRGGDYLDDADDCRSAKRYAVSSTVASSYSGFRVIFPDK